MEDLEFLAHLRGVQKVQEGAFAGAGCGGEGLGDVVAGVVDEKTFLRHDGGRLVGRRVGREGGGEPVPADVGGEVLLAGAGEEVVVLGVLKVGSGGAGGRGVAELGKGFTIVEGDEESVPRLGGEGGAEVGGGEGRVELVAVGCGGERGEEGEDVCGGGAEVVLGEVFGARRSGA